MRALFSFIALACACAFATAIDDDVTKFVFTLVPPARAAELRRDALSLTFQWSTFTAGPHS